ncbi:MAG: glycosyltransferase family 4 protein [Candidatus Omnitrophica bacterium]|nr:glycosyltransferase family 4 protein [Candidatus Omnitrophota bacterium]
MNILIVASDFKPLSGGIAEYTYHMAKVLLAGGNNIAILAPLMDGCKEFDKTCPVEVIRYDADYLYSLNKLRRYIKEFRLLSSLIRKNKIDVIIGNCLCTNPYIYWLVAKILGKVSCVFVHGADILLHSKGIDQFKKNLVLKNVNMVFCNTKFTQKRAIALGVPSAKTFVAYPGVSIAEFEAGDKGAASLPVQKLRLENKKIVFALGRLLERKGQDTLIRAMPKVLKEAPETVCIIGGEGPYGDKLKRLASEYGVEKQVIFVGQVYEEQRQAYYDICDVFVMVNRQLKNGDAEAFGMVFLEANICYKPVIGGRSGGVPEAVVHDKTGFLVDPLNIDEVAEKIIYLFKNPQVAKQMGEAGKQWVKDNFTWDKLMPKIEAKLAELIAGK